VIRAGATSTDSEVRVTVRKTPGMRRFEAAHEGRPVEQLIIEALNEHGSINGAARGLEMSADTLYFWILRLGIRIRTVAELPASVA